jgi:hypothetical protein
MKTRSMMFAVLVLAVTGVAMAADPFVGTWKLNVAKSRFGGRSAPQSRTRKIEAQGNGYKSVSDIIDSDGKPVHQEMSMHCDGKEYPATDAPPDVTVATKRIDTNTIEMVIKQGGKVVQTHRNVVSRDGKTLTHTNKGTSSTGQKIDIFLIFDKQ